LPFDTISLNRPFADTPGNGQPQPGMVKRVPDYMQAKEFSMDRSPVIKYRTELGTVQEFVLASKACRSLRHSSTCVRHSVERDPLHDGH
jgi:hypothetical protein